MSVDAIMFYESIIRPFVEANQPLAAGSLLMQRTREELDARMPRSRGSEGIRSIRSAPLALYN
jgi:hypothetical protein